MPIYTVFILIVYTTINLEISICIELQVLPFKALFYVIIKFEPCPQSPTYTLTENKIGVLQSFDRVNAEAQTALSHMASELQSKD